MRRGTIVVAVAGIAAARWWAGERREAHSIWSPPVGRDVGAELTARVVGSGPCRLALLHGMFNSGLYWGASYDTLAGGGAIVVPDLLGFGRSPRPSTGYTPDAHADAVAATLRACGADGPLVVGGHSLGALVALRLAARHPDLVAGVIGFAAPIYEDEASARRAIAGTDPLARLLLFDRRLCERLCDLMTRHSTLAALLVRLLRPGLPAPLAADRVEHSWASYHETLTNLVLAARAPAWLAEVGVPVQLVVGRRDDALDVSFLERLAAEHPHVAVEVVDDAGHDIPLTHPDECIRTLRRAMDPASS